MNENEPDKNWICSPEYYSGYSQHDSSIKNTSVYTKDLEACLFECVDFLQFQPTVHRLSHGEKARAFSPREV